MSFFFSDAPMPGEGEEPASSRITRNIAATRTPLPRPATPPPPAHRREMLELNAQLADALRVIDELRGGKANNDRAGIRDASSGPSRPITAPAQSPLREPESEPALTSRRPDTLPLTKARILSAASVVAATKPFDPPTNLGVALGEADAGWRDRCKSSPPVPSSYLPRLLPNLSHMLQTGGDTHTQAQAAAHQSQPQHQSQAQPGANPNSRSVARRRKGSGSDAYGRGGNRQVPGHPDAASQSVTAQTFALNQQIQSLTSALRICIDVIAEEGHAVTRWRNRVSVLERSSSIERSRSPHRPSPSQHRHPSNPRWKQGDRDRPRSVPRTVGRKDTAEFVRKLWDETSKDPTLGAPEQEEVVRQCLVLPATRLRKHVPSNRPRYASAWEETAPTSNVAGSNGIGGAGIPGTGGGGGGGSNGDGPGEKIDNGIAKPPKTAPAGSTSGSLSTEEGPVVSKPLTIRQQQQQQQQQTLGGIPRATTAPSFSKISIRIPTAATHRARTGVGRVPVVATLSRGRKGGASGAVHSLTPFAEMPGALTV
ncbi:hypothetical protein HKX48_008555 [Thoreauomyces humboldtii]|nr:hypothetical protein HKX48_008555 [Thoreauomyces humboldtii]